MLSIEELLAISRTTKKDLDYHSNKYLLEEYSLYHNIDTLQALIQANEKLIIKTAHYYYRCYGKYISKILDVDDLVSCGNIGLLTAIEKYSFLQVTEFSTYALHWIRQKIMREIFNNIGQCRIPVNLLQKIMRNPEYSLVIYYKYLHNQSIDDTENDETTERPIHGTNSLNYGIAYEKYYNPCFNVLLNDLHSRIIEALDKLGTSRNRSLYELRVGLKDDKYHTLEYVAKKYNMTRERVRQICDKIDEKLCKSKIIDKTDLENWY